MASVEIFVFEPAGLAAPGPRSDSSGSPHASPHTSSHRRPRRLSLVIGTPELAPAGDRWQCRVALADLHRPQNLEGRDSVEALVLAVEQARAWIAGLYAEGFRLARDRAGAEPFQFPPV